MFYTVAPQTAFLSLTFPHSITLFYVDTFEWQMDAAHTSVAIFSYIASYNDVCHNNIVSLKREPYTESYVIHSIIDALLKYLWNCIHVYGCV